MMTVMFFDSLTAAKSHSHHPVQAVNTKPARTSRIRKLLGLGQSPKM